jgi:hypothetical protein
MRRQRKSMVFNSDDWGLVDYQLPETVVVEAKN